MTEPTSFGNLSSIDGHLSRMAELLERLAVSQERQHDRFMEEMREFRRVAEEQSRTARTQQETITRFVGIG